MKIQFLQVQKNLAEKQQKNLAEKIALIEELNKKIAAKKVATDKAQVDYYATLDEADEKAYISLQDELAGLENELEEAEKGKALLENFVLPYPEGQLIGEVEEYIKGTGFAEKVDNYINAYNKLLADAKALDNQYEELQNARKKLMGEIYEIAREVRYTRDPETDIREIKDRYEDQKEKIDYRIETIEVKKIKGEC